MSKPFLILALLAAIPPSASAEGEPLGRLFLTPQQRQELNRQRLQGPSSIQQSSVTVNGEVRSSSGKRTRWINGQADWQNTAPTPALPIGDSVDPNTGERLPLLGDGHIQRTPRRP
ncbi:MAG: hypothetical protein CVU34_09485 [Betaproteobacteria bacterium HGW-Betaproteobacteria-7]|jgi:hypothetical protein|nr:MAG: hypothetical protein CVU34_09485 [Betaproteobacteria bacterium HGW-Betaproteobacteria-7]